MGTPTEKDWVGVSRLTSYQASFPEWDARPVSESLQMPSVEAKEFLDVSKRQVKLYLCLSINSNSLIF